MHSTAHRRRGAALTLALILVPLLGVAPLASHEAFAQDASSRDRTVDAWLDEHLDGLVELYEHLHANPELSLEEAQSAARMAKELRAAGYRVTTGVGGHGVVGVLENGPGKTVLIRGDMDGLPVREETGVSYASKVEVTREDGTRTGVMHACGHDVHMTSLVGTARLLAQARPHWSGTIVAIAQPAEELGRGALAMMNDGLFERFPRPDYTIALHVESGLAVGEVGYTSGYSHANVDSVVIRIHGRGGHGARPHTTVDPITAAAYLVTQLQTIVSRRVDPLDPAVVTVGSIHGGHKSNVIPNEVELALTVRSYSDESRKLLLDSIRQISEDTCRTFQCPRAPDVSVRKHFTPAVYADPALVARGVGVFERIFGKERVIERRPSMGGEDFGRYARELGVPGFMYRLGTVSPEAIEQSQQPGGTPLPSLHSSLYAPLPRPTLRTGVESMAHLVLDLLAK